MWVRLAAIWESLRTSYWFIPSIMSAAAVVLAVAAIWLDHTWKVKGPWLENWVIASGPDGVRSLLNAVAASMITIAGVTFSITIVALSLASQQFGPRMLYNFMRDRGNQVVLGTFVATFLYSMILLRSVDGGGDSGFVPDVAVGIGMLLTLASLGVLIYFIHHISASIQADNVVAAVMDDLNITLDRICGVDAMKEDDSGECDTEERPPPPLEGQCRPILSRHTGYVEAIAEEDLVRLAERLDVVIKLRKRAGHFMMRGQVLAEIAPPDKLDDESLATIRHAFLYGTKRTHVQDIEFGMDQLVEIALRALSPAINDPFTARMCVDHLGQAIARLARQGTQTAVLRDASGKVRVITDPPTFEGIVDTAFDQIRQNMWPHVAVAIRILEVIAAVAPFCRSDMHRGPLRKQADMVMRAAEREVQEPHDLEDIRTRYEAAVNGLGRQ